VDIELAIEAGIGAIREKGITLTEYAIALADEWLAPLNVGIGSPRDPSRRGAHVALVHETARELAQRLIDDGVVVDFRTPDVIRLGLSPLTTSFTEVWDGLDRLRRILAADSR
jgi:kynureninase